MSYQVLIEPLDETIDQTILDAALLRHPDDRCLHHDADALADVGARHTFTPRQSGPETGHSGAQVELSAVLALI